MILIRQKMIWADYPIVQVSICILATISLLSYILLSLWWRLSFLTIAVLLGVFNAARYVSVGSFGSFWWDMILGVIGLSACVFLYRSSIRQLFTDVPEESQPGEFKILEGHIYAVVGYLVWWGFIAGWEFLCGNVVLADATVSRMLPRVVAVKELWLIIAFIVVNIVLGIIEFKRCGLLQLKSIVILSAATIISVTGIFVYGLFAIPLAVITMTLAVVLFCLYVVGSFLSSLRSKV